MFLPLIQLVIAQTAVPEVAIGTDAAATIAAAVSMAGGALIGLAHLSKRLLRRWLNTGEGSLGKILAQQTELLTKLQKDTSHQAKLSAKIAQDMAEGSKCLLEVAHQLDKQGDRLGHLETLIIMGHEKAG